MFSTHTTVNCGHIIFIANSQVVPDRNAKCTFNTVSIYDGTRELFTYMLNSNNNSSFKHISYARIDSNNICCFYSLTNKYYFNTIDINTDNPTRMMTYDLSTLCAKTKYVLRSDYDLDTMCVIGSNIYIYNKEHVENIHIFNTSNNTIKFVRTITCKNPNFKHQILISEDKVIGTKAVNDKQVFQIMNIRNQNMILSQHFVPSINSCEIICYYKPNVIMGVFSKGIHFVDIHEWKIIAHITDLVYNSHHPITKVEVDGENFNYYSGSRAYCCRSPFVDNIGVDNNFGIDENNRYTVHLSIISIEARNEYLENENVRLTQPNV